MKAIINARIYDFNTYQEDMYIVFDKEIIDVGKMKDYKNNDYEEIDAKNSLVLPGLVNAHSHIYSTFARGMSVPFNPKNFIEILEQLWWKLDSNLTNEMTYYSGIVSASEYIKNGVTTIIDHHASGEIIDSLCSLKKALNDTAHMRSSLCFETSDRFNIKDCIEENISFISKNNDDFSNGMFGLHAAFTLSEETLVKVSKVLNGKPIHIHVAESIMDQDFSIHKYNERVVSRLNRHNLINKNSIITHGLYLSDEELDIIKEKEAVIAVNVNSNMNNSVGLPPVTRFMDKGIKVVIGNDGISQSMTNEYQALYFTMHHVDKTPTKFGYDSLLKVINDTYEFAGELFGIKLGKIKEGYKADLVILPYNEPTPLNNDNIFGHFLFGLFNDFRPKDVYINGDNVLFNYQTNDKLQQEYNKSSQVAQKLWNKMKGE
jgi:putative selenium metabolism protein SsnA